METDPQNPASGWPGTLRLLVREKAELLPLWFLQLQLNGVSNSERATWEIREKWSEWDRFCGPGPVAIRNVPMFVVLARRRGVELDDVLALARLWPWTGLQPGAEP